MKLKIPRLEKLCIHKQQSFCKVNLLTPKDIKNLVIEFNKNQSTYEQDIFLALKINLINSKKSINRKTAHYTITLVSGRVLRVCLITFCAIFGVGRRRIGTIVREKRSNSPNYHSNRGGDRKTTTTAVIEAQIAHHISKYPTQVSYYNRNKEIEIVSYLSSDLTLSDMFKDYNLKYPDSQTSMWIYRKVFNNKFNLKFKTPYSDLCDTCGYFIQLSKTPSLNTPAKSIEYQNHIQNSKLFYKLLNSKKNDDTLVCSFDMMQTSQLPYTRINSAYYKRQVSLHVEGLVICHKENIRNKLYCWNEYQAKRGSNEIASVLYEEFKDYNNSEVKNIQLYSDACPGQNRNMCVFSMLFYLARKTRIRFSLTFPVRGHSFIPPDRLFGRIETLKKKKETLLLQEDYEELFEKTADLRIMGSTFKLYDWKKLILKQLARNTSFKVSKIKRIEFSFNIIGYSYSYDGAFETMRINLGKNDVGINCLEEIKEKNHVSEEKQKDVESLLTILGVDQQPEIRNYYRIRN